MEGLYIGGNPALAGGFLQVGHLSLWYFHDGVAELTEVIPINGILANLVGDYDVIQHTLHTGGTKTDNESAEWYINATGMQSVR
jgi:hypothetical protein